MTEMNIQGGNCWKEKLELSISLRGHILPNSPPESAESCPFSLPSPQTPETGRDLRWRTCVLQEQFSGVMSIPGPEVIDAQFTL